MEDSHSQLLEDTESVLQPFLEMVEQDSSMSTVRTVVLKVLSDPQMFCGFDQLKAKIPINNNNEGGDAQPLLATLDLFSYGVYKDYTTDYANNNNNKYYLPLNETQIAKLQQLTVLTCIQQACHQGESALSYNLLGEALGNTSDRRWIEQVIISGLYAKLWNGRLCQKTQQLLLTSVPPCISRDVPLTSIPDMLGRFQALKERLDHSCQELETAHTTVCTQLEQNQAYWKSVQEKKKKAESQIGTSASGTVRVAGWSGESSSNVAAAAARRSSASRQSKRSRGGLGGSLAEPFHRF